MYECIVWSINKVAFSAESNSSEMVKYHGANHRGNIHVHVYSIKKFPIKGIKMHVHVAREFFIPSSIIHVLLLYLVRLQHFSAVSPLFNCP